MRDSLETLRALYAAYNRRDFDSAVHYAHPEIELRPALTEVDVEPHYRGHAELRRFFETITEAWETYLVEPKELIEIAPDRILAVELWHARSRAGLEFEIELIDVFTFRDRLITRIDGYTDKSEALAATAMHGSG
jgi:ketosteroid isomerase-like protein